MPNKSILPVILLISALLAACGQRPAPTPTQENTLPAFTATPNFDPCSSGNLPDEVKKIHNLTREFDDYSTLASNTPQAQLVQIIPEMQRILRDAEDQQAPACLKDLKQLQLSHMAVVVQTLMTFMTASDSAGAEKVNAGINQARELRRQYDIEMARLLGGTLAATLAPVPIIPAASATLQP